MNEYSVNVCFEDKKIHTKLSELVQNDYNSTKLKFTFDKIGRSVLFKLKNETETVLVDEIENNELILGPGVLNKSGYYEYEISLYGDNSKLTGYVIGQMYVRAELISTDEIVEPDDRVPVLDRLINDVNTAMNEANNLDIDVSKSGTVSAVEITKKDGTTETVEINDGEKGETGATPNISVGTVSSGPTPAVSRRGTDKNPIFDFILQPGYTPQKGVDYYTKEDKDALKAEITSDIVDDATSAFNTNATEKTTAFNNNATSKTTDFDTNATNKTNAYNNNHAEKLQAYNDNATSKTTAFNENYQEKLNDFNDNADTLDRKVEHYKKYSNALAKVSASGTELTIDDTAECPMEIELESSEMEQATTTGKNAFNKTNYSDIVFSTNSSATNVVKTNNYVSFTSSPNNNYSGIYIANANIQNYIDNFDSDTNYYISVDVTTDVACRFGSLQTTTDYIDISAGKTRYSAYGKITGSINFYVRNAIENGANIKLENIMISTSSDITYEPYTNGPSPNPSYPQDTHTITGDNEIEIWGSNLQNLTMESGTISIEDGQNSPNANHIRSQGYINVSHIRKILILTSNDSKGTMGFRFYNKNNRYLGRYTTKTDIICDINNITLTGTTQYYSSNSDIYYARIVVTSSTDLTINYEFRAGDYYSLTLDDLEYSRIGDYKDKFFKNLPEWEEYDENLEYGKWYLKKKIRKIVLNGSEEWLYNSTSNYFYTSGLGRTPEQRDGSNAYANSYRFRNINSGMGSLAEGQFALQNYSTTFNAYIKDGRFDNVEDFVLNLANNNEPIYYPLITPQDILLNNTLQTELDNIYEWALSYQDQTNISQENDDLPFNIKVRACKDTQTMFDNITNAIVSMGGEI